MGSMGTLTYSRIEGMVLILVDSYPSTGPRISGGRGNVPRRGGEARWRGVASQLICWTMTAGEMLNVSYFPSLDKLVSS